MTLLTEWLEMIAVSPWLIAVIFSFALLDAVLPVVPSETVVIMGGVGAGFGEQSLVLVVLAGAVGAFVGDNLAYQLGSVAGKVIRRRRPRKVMRRVGRRLDRHSGMLLIGARFVPGGRTMVTVSSGATAQPRQRFVQLVAFAAVLWAVYAAGLGFVVGDVFQGNHTLAFLIAFVVAATVAGVAELVGRRRVKGQSSAL